MPYSLRCPVCRQKFAWEPTQGMPDNCELCGAIIDNDDNDGVVTPFIRNNAKLKAVDDVYRQMEAGSITRADIAAQLTGAPASEMSALKITDMHDNQRAGDIAAKGNNPVSELMAAAPRETGLYYSQNARAGPNAGVGARFRSFVQHEHGIANPGCTTDAPSNETLQPGYRRRG